MLCASSCRHGFPVLLQWQTVCGRARKRTPCAESWCLHGPSHPRVPATPEPSSDPVVGHQAAASRDAAFGSTLCARTEKVTAEPHNHRSRGTATRRLRILAIDIVYRPSAPDSTGVRHSWSFSRQHATARRASAFCGTTRRGADGAAAAAGLAAAAALGRRFIDDPQPAAPRVTLPA